MWSYNFGWHTKQHCCNKRWLLLNAWEILVNALHSNELSALRNSFYPEYKHIYNVYIVYMHARMGQICLVFSVFAAVCFISQSCFLFPVHGALQGLLSKGDHKVIYRFFRLLINLCNIFNKTSKEWAQKW